MKEEVKKPDTINDAKTPKKLRDGFDNWVDERLREHGNGREQQ